MADTISQIELTNSMPTIVARNALGVLKQKVQLAGLVSRDYDEEVAQYGKTIQVPIYSGFVTNDKASHGVVTPQNPSDDSVSVTLNKHKEVTFIIEDVGKALSRPDIMAAYADAAMEALRIKMDSDISALFTTFDSIGSTASTMNRQLITEARQALNENLAPEADRHAIIGYAAEQALLNSDTFTFASYVGSPEAFRMGSLGQAFGFTFDTNSQLPTTGGSPDGERNFFFTKQAIVLASRPLPLAPSGMGVVQSITSANGMTVRTTMSYDTDSLGVKVTMDVLYGVAVLREEFGVQVITQA